MVASSSTGKNLAALCVGTITGIYVSTNFGVTWNFSINIGGGGARTIAVSGDGKTILGCAYDQSRLYLSTNFGTSWTSIVTATPGCNWGGVSYDGSILIATTLESGIRISTDSGKNWNINNTMGSHQWSCSVVFSSDSSRIIAGTPSSLYISTNLGNTWTQRQPDTSRRWSNVACSSDGTKILAASGTTIYRSTDGGETWIKRNTNVGGTGLACSSDGTFVISCKNANYIYISTDSGETWSTKVTNITRKWSSVACSSDGNKLVASVDDGNIWTSSPSPVDIGTYFQPYSSGTQITTGVTILPTIINPASIGLTWTSRITDINRTWHRFASSSDGSKLVGCVKGAPDGYIYTSVDSGVNWTKRMTDEHRTWTAVTSSFDGSKLLACVENGFLYTSTDSGVNWTQRATSGKWYHAGSSSDGSKLVACQFPGQMWTSTDSGVNWTSRDQYRPWTGVASSSDGSKLIACVYPGFLYTSTDSGVNWTQRASSLYWAGAGVASSSDGSKLVATVNYGANAYIYTSTDSGVNWTPRMIDTLNRSWSGVASSSNGNILAAASEANPGLMYISIDSGVTWSGRGTAGVWVTPALSSDGSTLVSGVNGILYTSSATTMIGPRVDIGSVFQPSATIYPKTETFYGFGYGGVTSSTDGSKLVAVVSGVYPSYIGGYIYTSTNSGASFNQVTNAGTRVWFDVASSSDGSKLVACDNSGFLYTSTNSGTTWTARTSSDWLSVASTPNGNILIASSYNNSGSSGTYMSTDSGISWNKIFSNKYIYGTAISSDGSKIVLCSNNFVNADPNGYIYTSTNSGVSFTNRMTDARRKWYDVASSTDGTNLIACDYGGFVSTQSTQAGIGGYVYTSTDSGVTWTARMTDALRKWLTVSSSSDGSYLFAGMFPGYLYISTNSGVNWNQITSAGYRNWVSIASSSLNGKSIVAASNDGYIYIYNDIVPNPIGLNIYGLVYSSIGDTWTSLTSAGSRTWMGLASSDDGTKLLASVYGGYLYTSTNSGATWTARVTDQTRTWQGVASSSDGTILYACVFNGPNIWRSTDSGVNWMALTSTDTHNWRNIVTSSDGKKLLANTNLNEYLYTSTNSGATWTQRTGAGTAYWRNIASSRDGTKLAVTSAIGVGYIFTSIDSGATWIRRTGTGIPRDWYGIAMSDNGQVIMAGCLLDYLYISTNGGNTWTPRFTDGNRRWEALAIFGSKNLVLVAGQYGGYINVSTDLGLTWSPKTSLGTKNWQDMVSTYNGINIIASGQNNNIYRSTTNVINDDISRLYKKI
jgi:hypothetical protein